MHIVCIGIGGAGLSNIAGILRDIGFQNVVGIDEQPSQITQQLQEKGIPIFPHWIYQIKAEDIVIYSSATEQCEEVQQAKKLKAEQHFPLLLRDYFEFLGEISKYFKTIAFAGTNGKSSSSAMGIFAAKEILHDFGLGIVGALVPDFGGKSYHLSVEKLQDLHNIFTFIFTWKQLNYDLVKKYYFFLEACEYQRHFLTLDLDHAIITSLELEHTDYFKDWEDYESAFLALIEKLKGKVFVLPNLNSKKILNHKKTVIIPSQYFDFQYLRGTYQQQNASLVVGLLNHITGWKPQQKIKKLIETFRGLRRRMEKLTTTQAGTSVFSDYGHIASSLEGGFQALKERFPDKHLICIFQPHQIHRILQGRDAFPKALKGYDETFIYSIYAARENIQKNLIAFQNICKEMGDNISFPTTIDALGQLFANHCGSNYLKTFDEVENIIEKADKKSIIVVYSAGDIDYQLRKYINVVS